MRISMCPEDKEICLWSMDPHISFFRMGLSYCQSENSPSLSTLCLYDERTKYLAYGKLSIRDPRKLSLSRIKWVLDDARDLIEWY